MARASWRFHPCAGCRRQRGDASKRSAAIKSPALDRLHIPVLAQLKKGLLDLGYNLQLNYTGEVLGNPTGGVKQGAIYEGLLEMAVDGDLDPPGQGFPDWLKSRTPRG